MTTTLTRADTSLRDAVVHQLDWDPAIDAAAIGVSAQHGIVALSGHVKTYSEKVAAERSALSVRGVRAVANDLHVRLVEERTDADLAADAAHALEFRATVPLTVHATVDDAYMTLMGSVRWPYQRMDAEKAVRHIRGVKGVINRIDVIPGTSADNVRARIVAALHRSADVDAGDMTVMVSNGVVTLRGSVKSWAQRLAAERAAASALGIIRVDNHLAVVPPEPVDEIC